MSPDDAVLAFVQASAREPRPWRDALRSAGSVQALLAMPPRELRGHGLDDDAIRRLHRPERELVAHWRDWLAPPAHTLLTLDSPAYPARLAETPDAPLALWACGAHRELIDAPQIAVVGSRNPTIGGESTAEAFAHFFAASGVTVTSGLAMGIDAAAHRGALSGTGGTVAVLGCGIDRVYPPCNAALAAEIAAAGVLVSEYPPGTPARAHRFPQRNRIIAGLVLGVLVVEATRRSGSLITARLANDYGREVFAIPGSIHNALSRGCHKLLRDGAKLVEEGADVLVEFAPLIAFEPTAQASGAEDLGGPSVDDPARAKLAKMLGFAPVTCADLAARAGLTAAEVSSMLLLLELDGQIEALPGGRYCRLAKRS